jgi:hypothetical protein
VRSKMVEVSRKIRALEKCIENLDRMRSKAPRFREKTNEEIGEEIKGLKEQIWELGRVGDWFEDREDELVLCGEFEDIAFMET